LSYHSYIQQSATCVIYMWLHDNSQTSKSFAFYTLADIATAQSTDSEPGVLVKKQGFDDATSP
jgi:hypothetical protein